MTGTRRVVLHLSLVCCAALLAGCEQGRQKFQQLLGRPKHAPAAPDASTATAPSMPESQIAARVNDAIISREEYKRRLELLPPESRPQTPEQHKEFLEQLVREELIVQDAAARGLGREAKVQRDVEDFRRGRLVGEFLTVTMAQVEVSSKDVEDYYNKYKEGFKEPARLKVRQVVTATEEEAKAVLVQLLQGAIFDQVARERSTGAGKDQGGDIGYIVRKGDKDQYEQLGRPLDGVVLAPPLEQTAFALDVGGISGVVKGPQGFVVLKCEERKPERQMGLVEVSDLIKNGLLVAKQRERMETHLSQLRGKARVKLTDQPLP